jgi:hypothetical protein
VSTSGAFISTPIDINAKGPKSAPCIFQIPHDFERKYIGELLLKITKEAFGIFKAEGNLIFYIVDDFYFQA